MSHATTSLKTMVSLLGLVICALICAVPTSAQDQPAQQEPAGVKSPINPRFLEYLQNRNAAQIQALDAQSHSTGYIPEPMDIESIQIPGAQRTIASAASLPTSYDLRSISNKIPPIRNQGAICGACWAFGALGSLESCLRPNYVIHGSENSVKNCNGWGWGCCDGGTNTLSSAYFVAWRGPIDSTDDPYDMNVVDCVCRTGLTVRYHVQKIVYFPNGKSNDAIVKQAIIDHGGVAVTYSAFTTNDWNANTGAHYSTARSGDSGYQNHIVTIIGWDDNYPKSNFLIQPPNNGAWLIRNSWGDWGPLHGYCWNSYDDVAAQNARMQILGELPDNYNANYQYDPMGWVGSYGYSGSTTGWFANVFTASAADHLTAAGWWSASTGSSYEIRVYLNPNSGPINTAGAAYTQTGTLPDRGYDTVKLNSSIQLEAGQKFSIVVKLTTPSSGLPIPVEYRDPGWIDTPTASSGQSYMSSNGSSWTDCTSVYNNGNVCLKAYTNAGRIVCETPTVSPGAGTYYDNTIVTVNCPTAGATMHYTLNGIDPTEADPIVASGGIMLIDKTETLKVTAFKTSMSPSPALQAVYTMKVLAPVCNPIGGTYEAGVYASAYCNSTGATVRYTTSGVDPKSTDPIVTSSIPIVRGCTFKAKAFKTNWTTSDTTSVNYSVVQQTDAFGAKRQPNGAKVRCTNGVITKAFPDSFYVETDDRMAGLRVNFANNGFSPGMRVGVIGTLDTDGGERCINATAAYVMSTGTTAPFAMRIRDLGGADWGPYDSVNGAGQRGTGGRSPNNSGLMVRIVGAYSPATPPSPNRFRLNDGSGSVDCLVPDGVVLDPDWQGLMVTGISACEPDGGTGLRPIVYIASQEDIISLKGAAISGKVSMPSGSIILNQGLESSHPYPDGATGLLYSFSGPAGTSRIRAHFYETYLDSVNDYMRVCDGNDNTVQSIIGTGTAATDYWSSWVPGNVMKTKLYSDYGNSLYGFKIDRFECDTTGVPASGATVTLSPGGKTAVTRGDGTYSFDGLAPGDYTVTVILPNVAFAPPSRLISLADNQRITDADFVASSTNGYISGRISSYATIAQAALTECTHPYPSSYRNTWTLTAPSDAVKMRAHFVELELEQLCDFVFVKTADGSTLQSLTYSNPTYDVWSTWVSGNAMQIALSTNATNNRYGFQIDKYEYQIASPMGGVSVSLSPGGLSTVTAKDGGYVFCGLANGDFAVTPSFPGATFTPTSRMVTVTAPGVQGWADFTKN